MWLWLVLWRATALLFVSATLNIEFFAPKRHLESAPSTQVNCYVYPKFGTNQFARAYNEEWSSRNPVFNNKVTDYFPGPYPMNYLNMNKIVSRRLEILFPKEHDLVKEHAKLVQDINSLKQYVFVAPFAEDTKDYDESIYHEIIEPTTTTTSTSRPHPTRPARPIKSSTFPIILLGSDNTRQVVKIPPFALSKSISLVGTTSSPLLRHPYPFVMKETPVKPLKVCMSPLPPYSVTTRRPSLWERLVNSILPRPR